MMMERAKTAPAPEVTAESKPAPATAQERVDDLERRLNDLDAALENQPTATAAAPAAAEESEMKAEELVIEKEEDIKDAKVPKQSESKPAEPVREPEAKQVKPKQAAAMTGKNNPLLARIMAAQERARAAEQKEKEAKEAAARAELERRQSENEAAAAADKLKQLQAMVETLERAQQQQTQQPRQMSTQENRDKILRELEGKRAESPVPAAAIPIMKSMDTPPPPPFDAMGLVAPRPQQHPAEQEQLADRIPPPSFEQNNVPVPSAPPESPTCDGNDHLIGALPMPTPELSAIPPPPSFAEFEEQLQRKQPPETLLEADGTFDFDVDGIPLSPEERQQMIEEQRRLYDSIMKEKAANEEAIARASADAFDMRSSSAAARAVERNEQMDSMGRDVDDRTAAGPKTEGEETEDVHAPRRYVTIGNNQKVALHGQERTKKAIKEGTALLVQCINCQNWMQVTATATLMFCPVCQVVCPVVRQSEVLTKEEAIQLTMDRKLAEKLQAEAYTANDKKTHESGYLSRLFGSGETSTATSPSATNAAAGSQSWWDKLSSIVSYGVSEEPRERGDLGVTRPPGADASVTTYPGQRRPVLTPATVDGGSEETRGLLSTSPSNAGNLHPVVVDGNEANLPAGRIAEQRPLLSCVYDSVSNVASSVFSNEEPYEAGYVQRDMWPWNSMGGTVEDGDVHGVDARSLLAVTEREEDERGEMT